MNTELFESIEDSRVKELYTRMWMENEIVKSASIVKSVAKIDRETGRPQDSNNSFSFEGEDKAETLIKVFGIKESSEKCFREKLKMACGGSGQEYRRITTLHSSSLCALLFFYNVTENNKLTIPGVGTFYKSVFEFRSPVIDVQHPSCMDVVLIGEDENGKSLLLFLESKFSEYYTSASKKLYKVSEEYLYNDYSKALYSVFWEKMNTSIVEKKDGFITLASEEEYYIGGIKQMISHYVGIRNNLSSDCEFSKQETREQEEVIEAIKSGAQIVLAEIIFDFNIGSIPLSSGKSAEESYSSKYSILADKMNTELRDSKQKEKFKVLPYDLRYSMFNADISFEVDEKVKKYYFG